MPEQPNADQHESVSELDGWRLGDTVQVMDSQKTGTIERIDPTHGLGRWPFLVVYPGRGEFCWAAAEWLTRVEETSDEGTPPDSAMCLSATEWDDMEAIAQAYLDATRWAHRSTFNHDWIVVRRRKLADRIVKACQ